MGFLTGILAAEVQNKQQSGLKFAREARQREVFMASAMMCVDEVLKTEEGETAAWVRGNDSELLARLLPLVREQCVVLDFSAVERIDAAGLSALIALYREARQAGHSFAVTSPTPRVAEVLAVVGLDRVLLAEYGEEKRPGFLPRLARSAA